MNEIIIHQIAREINKAPLGNDYKDIAQAKAVLALFVQKIQDKLNECLNAEANDGICDMTWRHDHCALLMSILYEWTEDSKYISRY